MTTIPPTPPPTPAPAAPQAVVTAVPVADLPAQIAALPPNSTIDATVLAAAQSAAQAATQAATQAVAQAAAQAAALAQRGVVQLSTPLGTIAVRLPIPVPPNALLRLLVAGSASAPQLRVIAINGQALPGAGPNVAVGGEPLSPASLAAPQSGPLSAARGPGDAAQADASAPSPTGAGDEEMPPRANPSGGLPAAVIVSNDPSLPKGALLTVRLLSVVPPGRAAAAPVPTSGVSQGAGSQSLSLPDGDTAGKPTGPDPPQPRTAVPGGPSPPPTPLADAEAGAGKEVIGAAPLPPATVSGQPEAPVPRTPGVPLAPPPAAAPSADPPAPIAGVVAPNSLAGQPLVQTPIGLITIGGGATLTPGSHVTLQPIGPPVPPAASAPSAPAASPPSGWAAIADTVATLQKADAAAAQLITQRLPDLGPQFAVNLVAWAAAAETGDMRAWLGDRAAKALDKAGRADLIAKLGADAVEARTPVALPQVDGEWQALTLPLFLGQRVERIRVTTRRPKGDRERDEGRDEEGLRFLVDVDMTRLGAMQFDGLVKRQAKQFDLIVRSRRELPEPLRRDINGIFVRALEGLGMTGGVVFKEAVAFIEPIPVDIAHAGLTA